jgi:hypothetical protein
VNSDDDTPVVIPALDVVGPQVGPGVYSRTNRYSFRTVSPAAGADISLSVPNGVLWDVNSLTGLFTASAGAANRLVGFQIKNPDGQVVYRYQFATALVATNTCTFTFSEDYAAAPMAQGNGLFVLGPQPKGLLLPGWTFGTVTSAIDAADQWSGVTVWIEEWLPAEGQ